MVQGERRHDEVEETGGKLVLEPGLAKLDPLDGNAPRAAASIAGLESTPSMRASGWSASRRCTVSPAPVPNSRIVRGSRFW
jgi:hypothetical protein